MPESTGGELLVVSAVSLTSISPLDMFVPYNRRHITPHVHRSASGSNRLRSCVRVGLCDDDCKEQTCQGVILMSRRQR